MTPGMLLLFLMMKIIIIIMTTVAVVLVIIIVVVVVINLCILRSIGVKIYKTGRYVLWVVLGTVCFSQSLVGRLTWSE